MLTELLQMIDEEQLFACLLEYFPVGAPGAASSSQALQRPSRPPVITDLALLKRLVPAHLYREAMQRGWSGMHALSFALRHRVTKLQDLFHQGDGVIVDIWRSIHGTEDLPLLGYSPLGIHYRRQPLGLCRAFDIYAIPACGHAGEPIFCAHHAAEAYELNLPNASAQAMMYRYYAQTENFSLYGESDLENLIGAFWKKYKVISADELAVAMQYFGWTEAESLRLAGMESVRRKFLQLSLVHHPDRGGREGDFVILQNHYHRLKNFLQAS